MTNSQNSKPTNHISTHSITNANNGNSSPAITYDKLLQYFSESYNAGRAPVNVETDNGTVKTMEYEQLLMQLAQRIAYSVMRTVLDPERNSTVKHGNVSNSGCSKVLYAVRVGIYGDLAKLNNIDRCMDDAYDHHYNKDGELVECINDSTQAIATNTLIRPLSDGIDIVHEAIVAILEEVEKQVRRGEPVNLEKPYKDMRLNKHILIRAGESAGWKEIEVVPIVEVYRRVRQYIQSTQSIKTDPKSKYCYIDDITDALDAENGTAEKAYRRCPVYADFGGEVTDFNGAIMGYTVDRQAVEDTDAIIAKMGLTAKQANVLVLKQRGYGYSAIATYLGVGEKSVRKAIRAIQKKAVDTMGLDPAIYLAAGSNDAQRKLTDTDKVAIRNMVTDGHTYAYIAQLYGVSKATISYLINGRDRRRKK